MALQPSELLLYTDTKHVKVKGADGRVFKANTQEFADAAEEALRRAEALVAKAPEKHDPVTIVAGLKSDQWQNIINQNRQNAVLKP